MFGRILSAWGNDGQKEICLNPVLKGEALGAVGFCEDTMNVENEPLKTKGITDGREDLENFNTRLIEGTHTDMKVYCARNKITIQNFVYEAIVDRLKK